MATRKRQRAPREVPEEPLFLAADRRADELADSLSRLILRLFRRAASALDAEILAAAQSLNSPSLVDQAGNWNAMNQDFRRILAPPPPKEEPTEEKARRGSRTANPLAGLDPSGIVQQAIDAGIQLGIDTLPSKEAREAGIDFAAARGIAYDSLNRDLIKQSLAALNESREAMSMLVDHPKHLTGDVGDDVRGALDGETMRKLFGLDKRQAQALIRELGGLAGQKPKPTRKMLRDYALRRYRSMLKQRIDTLAKTIAHEAMTKGQKAAWEQAKKEGLLKKSIRSEWVARVLPCPRCLAFDGKRVEPGKVFTSDTGEQSFGPPLHPNCILPGAIVSGSFVAGLKAFYSGPAVEIETASGNRLSLTINHPVVTDSGCLPAHHVRKGMDLLCYRHNVEEFQLAEANEYDPPAKVEEVFDLLSHFGLEAIKVDGHHLHGDAIRTDGDVYVVGSDWELESRIESEIAKGDELIMLAVPDSKEPFASGFSSGDLGLQSVNSIPGSLPEATHLPKDGLGIVFDQVPFTPRRFGHASSVDTALAQDAINSLSANSEFMRETLDRNSGRVFLDQVIDVREYDFRGHVYDLQSSLGWILANNIFISNCRCRMRLVRPRTDAGETERSRRLRRSA